MMERMRGFLFSAVLHAGLWALVFLPWSLWVGGRGSSSTESPITCNAKTRILFHDLS
jgi:hypothetical protein